MTYETDRTHDRDLRSWVESANREGTDFPIQNLPFGTFRREDSGKTHIGVAIGDQVLDLAACEAAGLLDGLDAAESCTAHNLNAWMACSAEERRALRRRLVDLLEDGTAPGRIQAVGKCLVPLDKVELLLPASIGDYTDFYASVFHATNIGSMFRPDNPLLPNYKHIPIGYHGRASSIVVSGTPVRRPHGQTKADDDESPTFGPSKLLDYELEVGAFIGPGNSLGHPIPLAEAEDHLVGLCLVNDWSARDLQKWEYQPLGPFLAKSFTTSISPWVVTAEALAPFRVPAFARPEGDPRPLPYLASKDNEAHGGIDLTLEVWLASDRMRQEGHDPVRLSRGSFRDLYWTFAQMITHHTSNGCDLRPGHLLASGTVSGPERGSRGCLMELTWRGTEPLELPTGETRKFLADGDEVIFRGGCQREGFVRIGFGECRGRIEAAG
ncbi:MAG: fumarylacetoacetase [Acidobacteria bacterium]|nr:fumarylacetoacetase [Acidobacteriota bacterium]